jgi:hypothetical protein
MSWTSLRHSSEESAEIGRLRHADLGRFERHLWCASDALGLGR